PAVIVLGRNSHRLERHATFRAMAWALLHHLWVHGAGVERALEQRLGLAFLIEETLRLLGKLRAAAFRATVMRFAFVFVGRLAGVRVHHHPAHGIDGHVLLAEIAAVHTRYSLKRLPPRGI